MADFIIGAVAEGIVSKLLSLATEEATLAWGFKDEIKTLQKRMKMIIAFLSDAESKSANTGPVELWLKNLKGAVYDADVLLDRLQYEVLRHKIEVQGKFKNKVTDFFSLSKNPLAFRQKFAHKIRNINIMLDGINKEASELGLQDRLINAVTHSNMDCRAWAGDLTKVVGRDHDVSIIVEKLLNPDNEDQLSVISIVGMAGQGKTTLAHLVCKNESVVRNFDKIIWVSVSDDFEETRILNHMAQSLTLTNLGLSSNYALVEKLKKVLKDKKYLLVLDDVWNEDPRKWNSLKGALLEIQASVASKIIVTTRSMIVASDMKASLSHELEKLSIANSWTMFKRKAFAEGGALETNNLVAIGEEIVRRCGGVPLVIDVLGSLMYSKRSEDEWLSVKNNQMWASYEDINALAFSVLKLSYDHLSPSSLKHCFAYSSIFPKDWDIEKDTMVQLWMALGLLPYTNSSSNLEEVGNKYFDTLLGKSLLQEAKTDDYGNIKQCKMHDLVHDLAQQTSRGYCLAVRDSHDVNNVSDDIVHLSLSYPAGEKMTQVCSHRLQTLFLEGSFSVDMLENFKFLRVLVLIDDEMEELPKSMGKMKHLRYLDIVKTRISKLPSSVTKLYNLQTLKVRDMKEVPETFGNLVNLRHCYGGRMFPGMGKLTSLRTFPLFVLSRDQGCRIEELGGLINLGGKLAIDGLEDIENMEEAQRARLFEKSKLESLGLKWSSGRKENEYEDVCVLEGLRPHSNLRSLEIDYFKGLKLPSWMMSESLSALQNLVKIKLYECDRCEQVPTLGHLPHLKKVKLYGPKKVCKIGIEFYHDSILKKGEEMVFFPALKELVIWNMDALEEWVDVKEAYRSSDVKASQFPNLEKFEIYGCKNLLELPNSLLQDCVALEEISIQRCDNLKVIPDIQGLTSLRDLSISYRSELSDLPRGLETLTSLKRLGICYCGRVSFVPDLERLTALERLHIDGFSEEIEELPKLPSSSLKSLRLRRWPKLQLSPQQHEPLFNLTSFVLVDCEELESLPGWLGNLSSLQVMTIYDCKKLRSVAPQEAMSRLTKLQQLSIFNCPLLAERCVRGSGPEWHKIQHIQRIEIDDEIIQDLRKLD